MRRGCETSADRAAEPDRNALASLCTSSSGGVPAQAAAWARLAAERIASSPHPSRGPRCASSRWATLQQDALCRHVADCGRGSWAPLPRRGGPAPSPRPAAVAGGEAEIVGDQDRRHAALRAATPARRSITTFCVVTSRPVVGSSAIKSAGLQEIAIAIIARWHMPPDSSCG